MNHNGFTADEMMAVEAARRLRDGLVCFVGIGLPSLAANLARHTHAPRTVLIYESGTIGAKPVELPLSIGDGELAETADTVVSVPELFAYWLQGERIDVSFLGAAQIDRHGNLNSTVIGDYDSPTVRLPGGGGAPESALGAREVFVMLRHTPRAFVERLDFATSLGDNVKTVITDLGVLEPRDGELALVAHHPGVPVEDVTAATGWELRVADDVRETEAPSDAELTALRGLQHQGARLMATEIDTAIVLPDDPSLGPEVQVDYPGYRSTRWRAPDRPLVTLPEEFHSLDGPVFGEDALGELDNDLTRQHDGEPLGERIIVTGRVLDEDGRGIPNSLIEIWQANAGGRYRHEVDQHPAPLDPNFSGAGRCLTDSDGGWQFVTIKPGAYPWGNHENAWRPQHIHFSVFGRAVHAAARHADVLPRRPAARARPDRARRPRPEARELMIASFDIETTRPEWALGYRWDIVLGRGRGTTPLESA